MNTLAWIVINAVLLGTAAVSVKLAKDLPKELKEEQKQLLSQEKPSAKKAAAKETAITRLRRCRSQDTRSPARKAAS